MKVFQKNFENSDENHPRKMSKYFEYSSNRKEKESSFVQNVDFLNLIQSCLDATNTIKMVHCVVLSWSFVHTNGKTNFLIIGIKKRKMWKELYF